MEYVTFKKNPAIVFVPVSNEPSPAAAVTFRSNPQIDLGATVTAPTVSRTVAFKSNAAILFTPTAAGRIGGGSLNWKV